MTAFHRIVAATVLASLVGSALAQAVPPAAQKRQSTFQVSVFVPPYCFELMQPDAGLASTLDHKGLLCHDSIQAGHPVTLRGDGAELRTIETGKPNAWRRLL